MGRKPLRDRKSSCRGDRSPSRKAGSLKQAAFSALSGPKKQMAEALPRLTFPIPVALREVLHQHQVAAAFIELGVQNGSAIRGDGEAEGKAQT